MKSTMGTFLRVIFISLVISSVQCYLYSASHGMLSSTKRLGQLSTSDVGEPLILTPYIEAGYIVKGKELARVHLTDLPQVVSYSGFFTVNKNHDSNQFFWYFPSMDNNETAPVLIWLQGGPGSSSLYGLFMENGPLMVVNDTLKLREINWALNHHLLFIDNPVGTGFSFTKDDDGYCTDETQVGEQLYSSVSQFFKLFPELQKNDFFVSGESYAGKYVPALAYTIHKKNPSADTKINLKGLAIGNGFCDPEHMLVYSEYLYQIGLIDWDTKIIMERNESKAVNYIRNKDWNKALDTLTEIWSPISISMFYNFVSGTEEDIKGHYVGTLESSAMRKAIHVGNQPYAEIAAKVHNKFHEDFMQSVSPWISELLDHYPVFTYNGQLDIVVAYPLTVNFLRNLKFMGLEEYKTAERHKWVVANETAGYVKSAGRLTELLVRSAGHMVPKDQPAWAWDMITRITRGIPFYDKE